MINNKKLMVGDNPFQEVSHLSEERVRARGKTLTDPTHAADLVIDSVENGANGFMFTANEVSFSILRELKKRGGTDSLELYALVPDVREFVRLAGTSGGVVGLARNLVGEVVSSANFRAVTNGISGILRTDPVSLLRSYLIFELYRLKAVIGKNANLVSLMLHEVLTDMALAHNMEWLFKGHIDFMKNLGIKPGFETRNFSFLVKKFEEWKIDFSEISIACPFNPIGFQMCPTREEWEAALIRIPEAEVIVFSILAGGYLKLPEAIAYLASLPTIGGLPWGYRRKNKQLRHSNFSRRA